MSRLLVTGIFAAMTAATAVTVSQATQDALSDPRARSWAVVGYTALRLAVVGAFSYFVFVRAPSRQPSREPVALLACTMSAAHPDTLIVVAGEPDRAEALALLSAGARAIVSKQLGLDQLPAVLRAAVTGRAILVSQELSAALASALPPLPDPALSPRELDVLALLVRGWDNAAIARELHISPSTAKGHVSHILAKLQSENRTDAALQGIRRGLVTP